MQKIGPNQLALYLGESAVSSKGVFHFVGARLEYLQQVAVATFEILKDVSQLAGRRLWIERQDAIDDMVRTRPVRGSEVARLGRWLEGTHHHPRRIRAQKKSLAVQKRDLRQNGLGLFG